MKKIVTLLCIIACLFSFTACGEADPEVEKYQSDLVDMAEEYASTDIISLIYDFIDTDSMAFALKVFTPEELEKALNESGIAVDGNALKSAVESFKKGLDTVGTVESVNNAEGKIDKNTIIVTLDVAGTKKQGTVEIVFSKDQYLKLESASISPKQTLGELMGKAGLNTLLGMGTVFAVLILICLIISSFSLIAKVQNAKAKKKSDNATGIDNAVAQIVEQEEVAEDDLELVAVIAAAVAAYEGASSSDGYVVRSIRKVNR